MNGKIALSFLIGLVVGSSITAFITTTMHNKKVEEEYIEEINPEEEEFIGFEDGTKIVDELQKANPVILADEYHNIAIKYDVADDKVPLDYTTFNKKRPYIVKVEDEPGEKEKKLIKITVEEFTAIDDFEKIELYYNCDTKELTDEEDNEIIDQDIKYFAMLSGYFDRLYLRNAHLCIDYVIIGWSQVTK